MHRICCVAASIMLAACCVRGDASPSRAPEKATSTAQGLPVADFTIQIGLGETARVADAAVEITFAEVLSDSRCPRGEACVWEGDAVILLHLRTGAVASEAELHTAARGPGAAGIAGWHVELLDLQPTPVAGRSTPREAYIASLRVTRGQGLEAPEFAIQ